MVITRCWNCFSGKSNSHQKMGRSTCTNQRRNGSEALYESVSWIETTVVRVWRNCYKQFLPQSALVLVLPIRYLTSESWGTRAQIKELIQLLRKILKQRNLLNPPKVQDAHYYNTIAHVDPRACTCQKYICTSYLQANVVQEQRLALQVKLHNS